MLSRQQQWMMRENASYPLKFCTHIPDKNDAVRDIQLNARTSERELQEISYQSWWNYPRLSSLFSVPVAELRQENINVSSLYSFKIRESQRRSMSTHHSPVDEFIWCHLTWPCNLLNNNTLDSHCSALVSTLSKAVTSLNECFPPLPWKPSFIDFAWLWHISHTQETIHRWLSQLSQDIKIEIFFYWKYLQKTIEHLIITLYNYICIITII